ncbi:MAG: LysR family transcriptional regulator [Caulobacteraceae bacterium]
MKPTALDMNLLATLDMLLEERSVSKTAARLNLSQAAVSAQLARLRGHFGDALFVPSGRGIAPTAFAAQISDDVRELMDRVRALTATRQSFDPAAARRRLHIAAGDIDTFLLIRRLNQALLAEAPEIQISIVAAQPDPRRADFMIVPMGVHRPELPTAPLYQDRYVCLMDRRHPSLGETISEAQYLEATHIVRRNGVNDTPSLEALLIKRMGLQRIEGPVVDAYSTIPFLLVGTPYVSTVPQRFAEEMARLFPLRIVELPFDFPTQTLALQWQAVLEGDMAAMWLKRRLQDVAREIYGPLPGEDQAGAEPSASSRKRRSAHSATSKSRLI